MDRSNQSPRDEDSVGADVVVVELAVLVQELEGAAKAVHPPSHLSSENISNKDKKKQARR